MSRTRATSLIAVGAVGLVASFLIELALVSVGRSTIVPPISLPITLIGVAVVVVAVAWPVRKAVKGRGRVDPFRAMRIAALAKACSLSGAIVAGFGAGVAAFLLTRSVVGGAEPIWLSVATVVGAGILLAGGLIAERFCTLPPEDDAPTPEEARA